MSKIALKSSSSGTATFTIESPATNTDRTLVLPDASGTVVLDTTIPSSAPTTTQVLDATAGASAGAVGTYIWAVSTDSITFSLGDTRAGSGLRPTAKRVSSASDALGASVLSGTWRAMGSSGTSGAEEFVTLWLRIS